jgi:hypothetical protein
MEKIKILEYVSRLIFININILTLVGSIVVLLKYENVLTNDIKIGSDKLSAYIAILCGFANIGILVHLLIHKGKVDIQVLHLMVLTYIEFNFKTEHKNTYKILKAIFYITIITLIFIRGVNVAPMFKLPKY